MEFGLLLAYKDLIKIFYGLIVLFTCIIIVLKSERLFQLSLHNGIRNLRNAFFFYGLAFAARYPLGYLFHSNVPIILFEYFLVVAGFFLLHSLVWRKFFAIEGKYVSSLFSPVTILFYFMALIIVILDFIWSSYVFLFISQIAIFFIAAAISFKNYLEKRDKFFPKFYFIAMLFSLIAWILNALAAIILHWNKGVLFSVYLLNIIVFLLFLFGVIKVTRM